MCLKCILQNFAVFQTLFRRWQLQQLRTIFGKLFSYSKSAVYLQSELQVSYEGLENLSFTCSRTRPAQWDFDDSPVIFKNNPVS